ISPLHSTKYTLQATRATGLRFFSVLFGGAVGTGAGVVAGGFGLGVGVATTTGDGIGVCFGTGMLMTGIGPATGERTEEGRLGSSSVIVWHAAANGATSKT